NFDLSTTSTRANWLRSALFCHRDLPASHSLATDYWPLFPRHCSPAPRLTPHAPRLTPHASRPTPHAPRRQTSGGQIVRKPSPAGYCLLPTAGLTKIEQGPISTIGLSLFSMSPNRAILSESSNFSSPHTPPPSRGAAGAPTFWHQDHVAPFACQEKRGRKLHRAFLLPVWSLVKCIPDRPMHAGVIVMALRRVASRDIKNLQGPETSVRPSPLRVGDRSAWPRNRLPKSPRRRACFPVSSTSFRAPRPLLWRPTFARSSCPTWFSKSLETSRSTPTAASRPIPPSGNGRQT